ncbi:hypothetical protein TIFTF001_033406 [Ficus carica]|uniref:Uncharacterized protein n=1 Tax=Ficus carica TaxID=3494 RepID=A0AA88DZ49_FICCA|nr:hypothetical protein TIFTF001_033406 [Ficus carica]
MGKVEEEHILPSTVTSDSSEQRNAENNRCCFRCRRIRSLVGLKCVLVLLLSAAVFLSAIFWLPPFLQYADRGDLDLDSRFKGVFFSGKSFISLFFVISDSRFPFFMPTLFRDAWI